MRKVAEAAALILVVLTLGTTAYAVWGPNPLPERIPTHFDPAGNPNGWGTPAMLWLVPLMSTIIYLLMTWVARFPSAFNFPMHTTLAMRPRLEAIALGMISWLKVEVVALFAWIQYQAIAVARHGRGTVSQLFMPLALVVIFGTIAAHIMSLRRAAR